jgi:RNA polymerase sigma factor (sigma-70 family)
MGVAPQLAEELFNEHSRRIYAYCLRQLGSPEEAEDAVQVTYLNACRSLRAGFEPDVARAWLFKVAQNVCLTKQRSSSRRARLERPQDLQAVQDFVAAPAVEDEELFGLDVALAGLPVAQRRAILLREWQGLSYREVAAEMGVTQSAVETLIFRARRSLASALEEPAAGRPARRRLLHSVDAGALLASLKTALAGNLSASVAAGVAVAASATTIAAGPTIRAIELRPSPSPAADAAAPRRTAPAPHLLLSDRPAPPVPATSAGHEPKGWAGTHPRGVGKGSAKKHAQRDKGDARHRHARASAQKVEGSAGAKSRGRAAGSPRAYGRGSSKG